MTAGVVGERGRAGRLVRVAQGAAGMNVWLAVLGFVTAPVMLRHLGRPAYGVFAIVNLVFAQLSNLELGFGYGLVRFLARSQASDDRAQGQQVIDTALAVFLLAGAAGGLALYLSAGWLADGFSDVPSALVGEATYAFRVGGLILLCSFLSSFFSNVLQGLSRFARLLAAQTVAGTLASLGGLGAVLLGGDLVAVMTVLAVVSAVSCVTFGILATASWKARFRPRPDGRTFRALGRYSLVTFGGGLGYQLLVAGPPAVLAASAPAAVLPSFAIPALVLQKLVLLVSSASLGFFSYASEESASASRSRLARVFCSHLRVTTVVMGGIVAVLVVFADRLLTVWISPAFADDAAPALRCLAVAALLIALSAPPADAARALGRPAVVMAFTWFAGSVAVAGTGVLVGGNDALAPAVATLVALALGTGPLVVVVARRFLGVARSQLLGAVGIPLLGALACTGVLALGARLWRGPAAMVGITVPVLAVYAALSARVVLSPEERATLRASVPARQGPTRPT